MAPGWPDLLRFPEGARLRIELVVKTEFRQVIETFSIRAAAALQAIDGATVLVQRLDMDGCTLSCSGVAADGHFVAVSQPENRYGLSGYLCAAASSRAFDLDCVAIQAGGQRDAYLAQQTERGWRHLLRMSYPGLGTNVHVSICAGALAEQLAPRWSSVLPAQICLARLSPLHTCDQRSPA